MKVLSISTSSKLCAVSILENSNLIKEKILDSGLTHSEKLLPIINDIFKETNLNLKDIDLLVCDKGPGSFTGIRIGISTVMAFSDSLNIPSIGISSLEALAYNVKNPGLICSLIDAKNSNSYFALYKLENNVYTLLEKFCAEHIDTIINILKKYNEKITFIGDGAICYKEIIKQAIEKCEFVDNNEINSYNLGLAGLYNYKIGNKNDILPLYLRKPQAERMLEAKLNGNK